MENRYQDIIENLDSKIAELKDEAEKLSEARDALVGKSSKREPEVISEPEDEEAQPAPKRRTKPGAKKRGRPKGSTNRKHQRPNAAKNGNGNRAARGTRKAEIISLLDEGLSPREIGDELGITPNYVYNVKRELA